MESSSEILLQTEQPSPVIQGALRAGHKCFVITVSVAARYEYSYEYSTCTSTRQRTRVLNSTSTVLYE